MDRALLERMVGAVALVLLLVIVAPALLDGTSERPETGFASDPDEDVRTQVIVLNEPRSAEVPDAAADPEAVAEVIAPERTAEPRRPAAKATAPADSSAALQAADTVQTVPKTDPGETPGSFKSGTDTRASQAPEEQPQVVVTEAARPVAASATEPASAPSQSVGAAVSKTEVAGEYAVQLGSFGQLGNARKYAAEIGARGFAVFVRSSASAGSSVHRVYAGPRPDRAAAAKLAAVLGDAGYKGIVVDLSGDAGNGGR